MVVDEFDEINITCDYSRINSNEYLMEKEQNNHQKTPDLNEWIDSMPIHFEDEDTAANSRNTKLNGRLYSQFASKNLKRMENAIKYNELKKIMIVKVDERFMNTTVLKIAEDGNCLFASLTHQLYCMKNGSPEHKKSTIDLRHQVVSYIRDNIKTFILAISHRDDFKNENTEEGCIDFVSNLLSKNGFWGGYETMLAVSNIYHVNILVFNEKGPFYLASGYSNEYDRTLLLAYRICKGGNHTNKYDHYDSVCGANEELLYKCADELATKLNQENSLSVD